MNTLNIMKRFVGSALIVVLYVIVTFGISSCSMPQIRVSAPYTIKEKISLGFRKAVMYQLIDGSTAFANKRYVPLFRFELLDEKGEVVQQYVGAYQEFLSRVAGGMTPEQKALVVAMPVESKKIDSGRVGTTYSFPNYEGEVSDLGESGSVVRTHYWSLDSVGTSASVEVFSTRAVSTPYTSNKMSVNRNSDDLASIRKEGEDYAYYDFKSFVLTRFRDK